MKKALLVIDVQKEYFTGKLPVTYPSDSFQNILRAIKSANERQIPVVVIQHTAPQADAKTFVSGSEGWKLHPEIKSQKYNHLVEKHLPGSFTGTDLEKWLQDNGIDTIVISGYMTQMCCDTTAR